MNAFRKFLAKLGLGAGAARRPGRVRRRASVEALGARLSLSLIPPSPGSFVGPPAEVRPWDAQSSITAPSSPVSSQASTPGPFATPATGVGTPGKVETKDQVNVELDIAG